MLFYTISIALYSWAIHVTSLFNEKAKLFIAGRRNVFQELETFKRRCKKEVIWFHAASLGEFEQGLPLMEAIKSKTEHYTIVVSFFSPSGYELRKDHPIADHTCYLPLDTKKNAKRFLDILDPKAVFFIKYEYWYHYLNETNKHSIPLYGVSAVFTQKHVFFKPYGSFYRKMLTFFDHTFVQDQNSLALLKSIGIEKSSVSGDTRFDRVLKTIAKPDKYSILKNFTKDDLTLVIGSAWPEDMAVVSHFINQHPEIRVIIAPHLISEDSIKKITSYLKLPFQLFTDEETDNSKPILILNTMGMLSSAYQYGDFAYIGGAFGDGLHNILEAVAFGLPVVFGNRGLNKFPEAEELNQKGGAFIVQDAESTKHALDQLMDEPFRAQASEVCKMYIKEKAGATKIIMSYLTEHQA